MFNRSADTARCPVFFKQNTRVNKHKNNLRNKLIPFFEIKQTAISVYLNVSNIGTLPTSIEDIWVGYRWKRLKFFYGDDGRMSQPLGGGEDGEPC